MPYPNEHAARIKNPELFESQSFRRKTIAPGIDIIMGKLKGENSMTAQAYRFAKGKFSEEEAKKWLKEHDIKIMSFEGAKKDNSDSIDTYRLDVFDNIKANLIEPFKETPEGYLKGRAIVTNTGIFNYVTRDGIVRELREPEEVFKEESLNSLKMIPITNNHPKEKKVTKDNIKDLQIGYTGETVYTDAHAISIPLVITDSKAIEEIKKDGKVSLSCGYDLALEFKKGMAFGNNQYDAIQKNIRYNHIALVEEGRAGDLAKLEFKIDSADNFDAIRIDSVSVTNDDIIEGDTMKTIKLDGVDYQAEAKVIEVLHTSQMDNEEKQKTIDKLNQELSKSNADRDTYKDDLDKIKSETHTISDEDIQKAVAERLEIIKVADALEVPYKNDKNELKNTEIKKAVILKKYPKVNLDGKDDVYVNARFDAIVENLDEEVKEKNNVQNKVDALTPSIPNTKQDSNQSKPLTKKDRYNKFCNDLETRFENYKGAVSVE